MITREEIEARDNQDVNFLKGRTLVDWKNSSGDEFRAITKAALGLKAKLTDDGLYSQTVALAFQKERTEMLKEALAEEEKWLKCLLKEIENKREELKKKMPKLAKKLEDEMQPFEDKVTKLQKAKRLASRAEEELQEISDQLDSAKKEHEKMQHIVLVHKTADKKQTSIYNCEQILVTELDFDECNQRMHIDGIFTEADSENFINNLPYYFHQYDEKERASIILFCEMVIYFKLSANTKIIPVFSNKTILDVLKLNGF